MENLLIGVISSIISAPISGIVIFLTIRFLNRKKNRAIRFVRGEWFSAYETDFFSESDWIHEKISIKRRFLSKKLIIRSESSGTQKLLWEGVLEVDDDLNAFGTWQNVENPARNGYCWFSISFDNNLSGFQITSNTGKGARNFIGHWLLSPSNEQLERNILKVKKIYSIE